MGVYSAMNAAVSGLSAQSYALENISGNIANSTTTGFKRLDTSFTDLIGDESSTQRTQIAGTVSAHSRGTNTVQGDLRQTQVGTHVAINGDGYFSVRKASGVLDGRPVFDPNGVYTRRGDFEFTKHGNLINGSRYYLMGLRIDKDTQNVSGNDPEIIQIDNRKEASVATTRIDYRANLPILPRTTEKIAGNSDLMASALIIDSTGGNGLATGHKVGKAVITADEDNSFQRSSLSGGAVTAYSSVGSAVNVQLRWAKTFNDDGTQPNTWSLYYSKNSAATGTEEKWQKIGDAQFDANGRMSLPNPANFETSAMTVDGANLGGITFNFGEQAVTQFAQADGNVRLTTIEQNGYPPGDLTGVSIDSDGRLVAQYSNGRSLPRFQISLVSFNADGALRRLDGGAFASTSESGGAISGANGVILGKTLEASNADIAQEFSKLIVAQQAYTANTKIIRTNDELVKEAINIIR